MQIYRNKRKPVCIKKKIILELQHVRPFIVLEDQYGRRDVMWKQLKNITCSRKHLSAIRVALLDLIPFNFAAF